MRLSIAEFHGRTGNDSHADTTSDAIHARYSQTLGKAFLKDHVAVFREPPGHRLRVRQIDTVTRCHLSDPCAHLKRHRTRSRADESADRTTKQRPHRTER